MTDPARSRILQACQKMMMSLARVLLVNGIGYKEFDKICRQAFVWTATGEFGVRGRETNASRVSAITGLPRKEVQKIRKSKVDPEEDSTVLLSPLADLLHIWSTLDKFQDSNGYPRVLAVGDESADSFDALVRMCMGDIPPGAVRAELVRLGAVEAVQENRLRVTRRSLIPPDADARLESAILYSLCGLMSTVAHNNDPRVPESERRFERYVESRLLTNEEISKIRVQLRSRLVRITEELDFELNVNGESESSAEGRRVGVGIYFSE